VSTTVTRVTLTGSTANFKITSDGCTGVVFPPQICPSAGQLPAQYCEVDYEFDPAVVGHLKAATHPVFKPAGVSVTPLSMLGTGDFQISLTPQGTIANDFPMANATENSPGSVPITFSTTVGASQTATWTADLSYTTSGGVKATAVAADKLSFKTTGAGGHTPTITGLGGEMAVTATCAGVKHTATGHVTGIVAPPGVPNSDITDQLETLYDGLRCPATSCPARYRTYAPDTSNPILLGQIAVQESDYQQFVESGGPPGLPQWPPYGIDAFWPNESYQEVNESGTITSKAGAHIGLMQVPLSMDNAWNWLDNTQAGATGPYGFQPKLVLAAKHAAAIQTAHNGGAPNLHLPNLSSVQLENMALLLYGPFAPSKNILARQYYIPQCTGTVSGKTCSSGWQWEPNTAGNPNGVDYVCNPATVPPSGVRNQTPPGLSPVSACVQ
jgi:hypothetical protein